MPDKNKSSLHKLFKLVVLIKGIDGILDILIGLFISFTSLHFIRNSISNLFRPELIEDPSDKISSYLFHVFQNASINTKIFWIFYLMAHGIVKILLALALFKGTKKEHTIALFILALVSIYEIYRFTHTHSIILLIAIIFDSLIFILAIKENKNRKN